MTWILKQFQTLNDIWRASNLMDIADRYKKVRQRTEQICAPLQTEDYVVQPVVDVSPPKWHIGHTTWFFETFILKPYFMGYQEYNPEYNYVFNSYYETVGSRVIRTDRGNLSRPTVADIYAYRQYVDEAMAGFLCGDVSDDIKELLTLGFNNAYALMMRKRQANDLNIKTISNLKRYLESK